MLISNTKKVGWEILLSTQVLQLLDRLPTTFVVIDPILFYREGAELIHHCIHIPLPGVCLGERQGGGQWQACCWDVHGQVTWSHLIITTLLSALGSSIYQAAWNLSWLYRCGVQGALQLRLSHQKHRSCKTTWCCFFKNLHYLKQRK